MEPSKQKALEQAGWRIGDAADFLEMSLEERQRLDTRVANFGLGGSPGQLPREEENL
ncbi:MAG: hypothetical protein WDZ51_18260 [Pirellulaceae bacterium]